MSSSVPVTCKWQTPDKHHRRCRRQVYGNSDYCLFHKLDKNEVEGQLFWKVINYNPYLGFTKEELEILSDYWLLYHENRPKFLLWKDRLNGKLQQAEILNYSEKEQASTGFDELCKSVQELYRQFRIAGSTYMEYVGFIFPAGGERWFKAFNYPVDFPVNGSVSDYPVDFLSGASAYYDFSYARFEENILFFQYKFPRGVSFKKTVFAQGVIFHKCIFSGRTEFKNTKRLVSPMDHCSLFENSVFSGDLVIFENLDQLSLTKAKFSRDTRLQIQNVCPQNPKFASEIYRRAQEQCKLSGQFREANKYQYQYLECRRQGLWHEAISNIGKQLSYCLKKPTQAVKTFKSIWDFRSELKDYVIATIYKWTTGYLLKPERVVYTMLFVILCMSVLYPFVGISHSNDTGNLTILEPSLDGFGHSLYFSVATFTTLVYGDYLPTNGLARTFCNIESFLGIMLYGFLIVSLAKVVLRE